MRHPHADVIIAFAEGKKIQYRNEEDESWILWNSRSAPQFFAHVQYRIKPTKTPGEVASQAWFESSSPLNTLSRMEQWRCVALATIAAYKNGEFDEQKDI